MKNRIAEEQKTKQDSTMRVLAVNNVDNAEYSMETIEIESVIGFGMTMQGEYTQEIC